MFYDLQHYFHPELREVQDQIRTLDLSFQCETLGSADVFYTGSLFYSIFDRIYCENHFYLLVLYVGVF